MECNDIVTLVLMRWELQRLAVFLRSLIHAINTLPTDGDLDLLIDTVKIPPIRMANVKRFFHANNNKDEPAYEEDYYDELISLRNNVFRELDEVFSTAIVVSYNHRKTPSSTDVPAYYLSPPSSSSCTTMTGAPSVEQQVEYMELLIRMWFIILLCHDKRVRELVFTPHRAHADVWRSKPTSSKRFKHVVKTGFFEALTAFMKYMTERMAHRPVVEQLAQCRRYVESVRLWWTSGVVMLNDNYNSNWLYESTNTYMVYRPIMPEYMFEGANTSGFDEISMFFYKRGEEYVKDSSIPPYPVERDINNVHSEKGQRLQRHNEHIERMKKTGVLSIQRTIEQ